MKAHINIGSNLGDSRTLIRQAVAEIALLCSPTSSARCSDFVESEPWGFTSSHKFVNLAIEIDTDLTAPDLLHSLQAIEHSISRAPHRNPDGSYTDRHIDIDLIFMDALVVNTPELTLPHPRMHLRRFVLEPLCQLSPQWVHPLKGKSAADMLASLEEKS